MNLYLPIAEIALPLPVLFGLGLAVGVLSGMFGVGGGFITTPMLIFLGVPPAVAVGTGTSQVVASSVSGALGHWSRGNVDLKMGAYLIVGGLFGATTGIWLQQLLKAAGQLDFFTTLTYVVMLGTVGGLMLFEAVRVLWRQAAKQPTGSARRGGQHSWILKLPLKTRFHASKLYMSAIPPVVVGAFVGWLTAIMGVGGGFLLVPALIYILRMPTRIALGTSAFQIIFVAAYATLLQATQNYSVDAALALPLITGGVIGAHLGVVAAGRLNPEQLRALLGVLVVAVAIRMAAGLVLPPTDVYSLDTGEVRVEKAAAAKAPPAEKGTKR
ncbi:MAG: sulfite exporter TauE/SafE family protein [Hyphomicrobiaceae bacterium]|nr:sulfite exporter TauE/SafE family protein [Hyphomicrobiaceae bacterium]